MNKEKDENLLDLNDCKKLIVTLRTENSKLEDELKYYKNLGVEYKEKFKKLNGLKEQHVNQTGIHKEQINELTSEKNTLINVITI